MKSPRSGPDRRRIRPLRIASEALLVLALSTTVLDSSLGQRLDGFNIVALPNHPFGSATAGRALNAARNLGATAVAVVPFLWQSSPSTPDLVAGSDMSDEALRASIRQAHRSGLSVIVKPHIWVPQSWAVRSSPLPKNPGVSGLPGTAPNLDASLESPAKREPKSS
jgi:hypothetical protein